jgi:hypothetical protein
MKVQSGASYVYVGGRLRDKFEVVATLAIPKVSSNKGAFYSDSVTLLSYPPNRASVSVALIRTRSSEYRQELGITWVLPGKGIAYRDTRVFLRNSLHRLSVGARSGHVYLGLDGNIVCLAPFVRFFTSDERKFFEVETEVAGPGDHASGIITSIMRKDDGQLEVSHYDIGCIFRGFGVAWTARSPGTFVARGSFQPGAALGGFGGVVSDAPCKTK